MKNYFLEAVVVGIENHPRGGLFVREEVEALLPSFLAENGGGMPLVDEAFIYAFEEHIESVVFSSSEVCNA